MPAEGANQRRLRVISQRYRRGSIILTTNRGVGAWGHILADTTIAAAMLDRLVHHSVVINITGGSHACAPTGPAPANSPEEVTPRVPPNPVGELPRATLGILGERRQPIRSLKRSTNRLDTCGPSDRCRAPWR
jgi:hypothetical protein